MKSKSRDDGNFLQRVAAWAKQPANSRVGFLKKNDNTVRLVITKEPIPINLDPNSSFEGVDVLAYVDFMLLDEERARHNCTAEDIARALAPTIFLNVVGPIN